MAKFVPKQKMSKKAQRALNAQSRVMWDVNPITRKVESKKIYNRKKSLDRFDDYGRDFSYLCGSFPVVAGYVRLQVVMGSTATCVCCS